MDRKRAKIAQVRAALEGARTVVDTAARKVTARRDIEEACNLPAVGVDFAAARKRIDASLIMLRDSVTRFPEDAISSPGAVGPVIKQTIGAITAVERTLAGVSVELKRRAPFAGEEGACRCRAAALQIDECLAGIMAVRAPLASIW